MFYLLFAVRAEWRAEWRAAAHAKPLCFVKDPEGPKLVAVIRRLCSSNLKVNF